MSFTLKSHNSRHKLFIGSIAVLLVAALGQSTNLAIQSINDREEAEKLLYSGLDLIGEGKIEEGLAKLESADSKSPRICYQLTASSYTYNNAEGCDQESLHPELKLKRLNGIKFLRGDDHWVDEERIKLLEELNNEKEVITLKERELYPWYSSNDTTVIGVDDSLPKDAELARLLWTQNRKAEAIARIDRAVILYPWNIKTRELAEKIYKDQKQTGKLRLIAKGELSDEEVSAIANVATSYNENNRAGNLSKLDRILEKHPWCATALIIRSATHLESQNTKKAIADADKILALYPGLAEGYYRRAKAQEELGDHRRACADYESALQTMPNSSELLVDWTNQAIELKLNDKVLQSKTLAIKLAPHKLELYKEKAEFLQSIGRVGEAEKVIDQALPIARMQKRCNKLTAYSEYAYEYSEQHNQLIELLRLKAELRWLQADQNGAIDILSAALVDFPEDKSLREKKTEYLLKAKKLDLALASINESISRQGQAISLPILSSFNISTNVEDAINLYELPTGGNVSHEAIANLETRIKIYAAMNDKANQRKDQLSLLHLKRLELESSDNLSDYVFVLESALDLSDRAAALNIAERLSKSDKKPEPDDASLDLLYEKLQTTTDVNLALEVLNRLETGKLANSDELAEAKAMLQARVNQL